MKRYIGVDLHTNSFTCCFLQEDGGEKFQTWRLQGSGLGEFLSCLQEEDEVAIEATANSTHFYRAVEPYVSRVIIIAPGQFEVIKRSVKKTDKNDARAIAHFLSKNMLPPARIKSEEHMQLSSLIGTRDKLVKTRTSLINKVHGLFVRNGLKVKKATLIRMSSFRREVAGHDWCVLEMGEISVIEDELESLHDNINKLEKIISDYAKTMPGYASLISIKGIGPLSAALMLTHIGDIRDFKNAGKLAAYFGIVPRMKQSNDMNNSGRITKRGNKLARTTLVQCTWVAIKYSSYLHRFYESIKARRGTGKAIIATARKLLNIIFDTLKRGWVFEDFCEFKIKSL